MIGTFQIIDERTERFNSKTGPKAVRRLALLDLSRPALIVGLDYEPKGDDATKLPEGNCVGQQITIGVRNLRANFGGRFLIDGELMPSPNGANGANGAGKPPVGK